MKICFPYRTSVFLIIILLGVKISVFAQESSQIVMGIVRNSSTYEPISFAFVKNEMRQTKIVSDEQGNYIISVNRGDLLKITAIGYEDGFYIISDPSAIISDFPIQLKPRIYELKEFTLTPYKTVMQFKHAFAQLDLPKEKTSLIHFIIPDQQTTTTFDAVLGAFGSPISFFYNNLSHRGKMIKKYSRLVLEDKVNSVIYKRLNFEFVASIVPIYNVVELEDFIGFCQFDLSFILNASEYVLIAAIQRKHLEYINKKSPLP